LEGVASEGVLSGAECLVALIWSSRDTYRNIERKDRHRRLIMLSQESLDLFISSQKDISRIMLMMEELVDTLSSNQEVKIIASGQDGGVSS